MAQPNTQVRKGNGQQNGNGGQRPAALVTTQDPRYQDLRRILEIAKTSIGQIVSRMISPDELVRLFLNAACKVPDLLRCAEDPRGVASIGLALMKAAAMNLRPDGRNGHLIPFWNNKEGFMECQFFPDYKGMVKLMCLSPKVAMVQGNAVRENDVFEFEYGSNQFLKHRPALKDRGELIAAYAYYTTPQGDICFRVLNHDDVMKRKAVSKSAKSDYSPWTQWPDPMWTKSALHDLAKIAPLGDQFDRAVAIDELDEAGALTQDDLKAMSHTSGTKGIDHQEQSPTADFTPPEDSRETEPARQRQQSQPEKQAEEEPRVTMPELLGRIANAPRNVLASIQEQIDRENELGSFGPDEQDTLMVAMQERRKQLNAR